MGKDKDVATARAKASKVLSEQVCKLIRFNLGNVSIQWGQHSFIGGLIRDKWINVDFAGVHSYDHTSDTVFFTDPDPDGFEVVHEATHAVIDYTMNGRMVTKGVHEACAYISETIYSLATTNQMHDTYMKHLNRPVYLLAKSILDHNNDHKSGLYTCSSGDVGNIIAIMDSNKMPTGRTDRMNGIKGVP